MKNIAELCQAAHAQSVKSGFWSHDEGCQWVTGHNETGLGSPLNCHCVNLDLDMKIALIHSELSEALEEFRLSDEKRGGKLGEVLYKVPGTTTRSRRDKGFEHPWKPEGFVVELADAAIRVFDLNGRLGRGEIVTSYFESCCPVFAREGLSVGLALRHCHRWAGEAEAGITAARLLSGLEELAASVGGNIDEAIRIKMAYNATREHKHGKVC